jgi:hypothetical protein
MERLSPFWHLSTQHPHPHPKKNAFIKKNLWRYFANISHGSIFLHIKWPVLMESTNALAVPWIGSEFSELELCLASYWCSDAALIRDGIVSQFFLDLETRRWWATQYRSDWHPRRWQARPWQWANYNRPAASRLSPVLVQVNIVLLTQLSIGLFVHNVGPLKQWLGQMLGWRLVRLIVPSWRENRVIRINSWLEIIKDG